MMRRIRYGALIILLGSMLLVLRHWWHPTALVNGGELDRLQAAELRPHVRLIPEGDQCLVEFSSVKGDFYVCTSDCVQIQLWQEGHKVEPRRWGEEFVFCGNPVLLMLRNILLTPGVTFTSPIGIARDYPDLPDGRYTMWVQLGSCERLVDTAAFLRIPAAVVWAGPVQASNAVCVNVSQGQVRFEQLQ